MIDFFKYNGVLNTSGINTLKIKAKFNQSYFYNVEKNFEVISFDYQIDISLKLIDPKVKKH